MTTGLLAPPVGTAAPPPRPPDRSLRRLQLAGVSLFLILLTFSQSSGLEAADTKLDLVVTPWRFLVHSTVMWDPTANAGQLQNQAYGYLFPMGPFFLIGHWLALPPWVIQRTWESTLLVIGFLGMVRLARLLGVAGFWPRVVAGLVYALAPRTMMELGVISSEILPVALAPWVLIPLVVGSRSGSTRRAAARSGVAVLLTGGVNAAATLAILPIPALWLLTRSRGKRRASLMRWWPLAVGLACLWWAVPLVVLGKYSPPFLDWIESAAVTTSQTSIATTLRGAEHWEAYLGPGVWPTGNIFVAVRAVVLATALVSGIGILGLLCRRVPHRAFLVSSLGLGLVFVTFGHHATVGPLLAGQERQSLDGALNAFRNVHKFDPVIRLPIAIGAGHAAAATAGWLSRIRSTVSVREARQRRWIAVGVAVALGTVAAAPAITGQIIPQTRVVNLPSWWSQTGAWLGQQPGDGRALVVPGAAAPIYVWGAPNDDALQPVADGPWTVRDSIPLAQAGYIRLLDALETQFASGERDPTLASLLARSGIRYVIVRNDINAAGSQTVSPLFVTQTLLNSPGFRQVAHFGASASSNDPNRITDLGATSLPGAVTIFSDDDWTGPVAVEAAANVVHANGSSDELPDLVADGVRADQPVEFGPVTHAGDSSQSILDDGLRRREFGFGGIDSYSETLPAAQPFRAVRATPDYLPTPTPPLSTVSYPGVAGVSASSSGADGHAIINRSLANGPYSALDGNALTAWRPGAFGGAVNQWLQVNLLAPIQTPAISVAFAGFGEALPDSVRITTSSGSRVEVVTPDRSPQSIALPPGPASFVRITILHIADGSTGTSVGIAELNIPGVKVSRTLDIPGAANPDRMTFSITPGGRTECLTVSGAAACDPAWQIAGEERNSLDRSIDLSAAGTYRSSATVRLQPDGAVDSLLDAHSPISAVATSTDSPDPRERPGAAVDGNPATGWVAASTDKQPDLRLTLPHRVRLRGFRLFPITKAPTSFPARIVIGVAGRLIARHVPTDGVIRFRRPRLTRVVSIEVLRSTARISTSSQDGKQVFLPVGIGEVRLLGPKAPRQTAAKTLTISCRRGPVLDVDSIPVTMAVHAPMATALQGLPVTATPCGAGTRPLQLPAGANRFAMQANNLVRPQTLQFNRADVAPTPSASPPPQPRLLHWGATNRSVQVSASTASLLVVHENQNAGWHATIDGKRLTATTVDGWQQAWLLPAGTSGVVHLVYAPQRTVIVGLAVGAAAALLLIGLALWRRRRPDVLPALRDGSIRPLLGAGIVVAVLFLLGSGYGVVAALVALVVMRLSRRRPVAVWLAGAALAAVAGCEFVAPVTSSHPLASSVGVQALCLLAVAIVLAYGLASRRPPPGLGESP